MHEQLKQHLGDGASGLVARLEFETLLADISARFVNVPAEDVDREIVDAQRRLCECLGMDRAVLWQASETTPRVVRMTHIYPLPNVPIPDNPEADDLFPWVSKLVGGGEHLAITSLSTLPPEAARDRQTWETYGTKSALVFPLSAGGGPVFGGLAFDALQRERDWPEEIVIRCRVIAQVFANALARKRLDRALRESEQRYRSIAMNLPGLIYQFYARDDGAWGMRYVDPRAREICGLSPEPLDTFFDRFAACVAPDCRDAWMSSIREAVQVRRGWEHEVRFIKPDGHEIYLKRL